MKDILKDLSGAPLPRETYGAFAMLIRRVYDEEIKKPSPNEDILDLAQGAAHASEEAVRLMAAPMV